MREKQEAKIMLCKTSNAAKRIVLAICFHELIALTGCGDMEWYWGKERRKVIRPTREPTARKMENKEERPGIHKSEQKDLGKEEEIGYYQLVLLSEPAPAEAPPGIKHVRLQRARARDVGELLSGLYLPSGPAGTINRYTLIYPTRIEWEASAKWAAELDVPSIEKGNNDPVRDIEKPFAKAVSAIYAIKRGESSWTERIRAAESYCKQTLNDKKELAMKRWAAGMLAGNIMADQLYDYEKAQEYYQTAEEIATPGSLEQMSTLYARARAHIQNGKPGVAKKILTDLIGQFDGFRKTETFDRATELLKKMNR